MEDYSDARNPMGVCAITLLAGVAGFCLDFIATQYIAGLIVGAVGMVIGGYAINKANRSKDSRMLLIALAGIGLVLSVVAFMLGLKGVVA